MKSMLSFDDGAAEFSFSCIVSNGSGMPDTAGQSTDQSSLTTPRGTGNQKAGSGGEIKRDVI